MTPLDLAHARLAEAAVAHEAAAFALREAVLAICPHLARCPVTEVLHFRAVEAAVEGDPAGAFARVYSAFARARRTESKARSAAHRARLAEVPAAKPKPAAPKPETRLRRLAEALVERRAEAMAA
jgi:hypothetical protein